MRKYRNDSLINEHKSVLAPYSLQTIKGNGRQACCRTICRDLQTSVDLRRATTTGLVLAYENSSIVDTTPPAIAVVPDFTSRSSPQSDHFTNVVVQLLRCRLSRPPRVSTDVTQRRRDDNLQIIWRASPRVLCSKLHYLRLCRPKITMGSKFSSQN